MRFLQNNTLKQNISRIALVAIVWPISGFVLVIALWNQSSFLIILLILLFALISPMIFSYGNDESKIRENEKDLILLKKTILELKERVENIELINAHDINLAGEIEKRTTEKNKSKLSNNLVNKPIESIESNVKI